MKSQALIVEFVIFFVIGLGFFLLAGNIFRFQSNIIKQDVLDLDSNLTSRQMSSVAIAAVDSCKSCDRISIITSIKPIAGYSPMFSLNGNLTLSIEPENRFVNSSLHNLVESVIIAPSEASAIKPINLTYNRINNNLVIA